MHSMPNTWEAGRQIDGLTSWREALKEPSAEALAIAKAATVNCVASFMIFDLTIIVRSRGRDIACGNVQG